jgi:hypothetical protein
MPTEPVDLNEPVSPPEPTRFAVGGVSICEAASGKATRVVGVPRGSRVFETRTLWVVAAVAFASSSVAGWAVSSTTRFGRALARATGQESVSPVDAELLAVKAEAESLTVAGRLAEAHAVYRRLADRTVGRTFAGRLTWDLAERAKSEQDRVYWILLSNARGADLAFFRGRGGTADGPGVLSSGRPKPADRPRPNSDP